MTDHRTWTTCNCEWDAPERSCDRPFCHDERCGKCHQCKWIGVRPGPRTLTLELRSLIRFYEIAQYDDIQWKLAEDKGWIVNGQWTPQITRMIFDAYDIIESHAD